MNSSTHMSGSARIFSLSLACLLLAGAQGHAQAQTLSILSHSVHQNVLTGGADPSKDVTAPWREETGLSLNWITADITPLHDRLLREASLQSTSVDVAFLVDRYASRDYLELFEPLDACLASEPALEDIDDISPALLAPLTIDGQLFGLPYRHATTALFYNETIFAERGIETLPQTMEEVIALARELTFTREDGSQVAGLALLGTTHPNTLNIAYGFGHKLIDDELNVHADSPGMREVFALLRELYAEGVLSSGFAATGIDQQIQMMQSGRSAMGIQPFSRFQVYNDPARSQYAGAIKAIPVPGTPEAGVPIAAQTEFWSMVIPKNSQNKEAACSFIKAMMSKEAVTLAALNGNGPTRFSTYDDPRVQERLPYARAEELSLESVSVAMPAFPEIGRAVDVYLENMQAAALGLVDTDAALNALQSDLERLVAR